MISTTRLFAVVHQVKKTVALSFVVRHLPKFEKLPGENTEAEVKR